MEPILKSLQRELLSQGYGAASRGAKTWLKNKIRELKLDSSRLMRERDNMKFQTFVGRMYFFFYNPKTKEKLPYYDIFPLVIPLEKYKDGFLGINLHYVNPKIRFKILENLSNTLNNSKLDETTRMRINYDYVKNISSINMIKPCLKRYLTQNVGSKFLHIDSSEWHLAALLPFEAFMKQPKSKVFSDSEKDF